MPLKKLLFVQVPARRHNATVPSWRPQHRWRPVKSQKVLITHFMSLKFEDYSKHKVCQILWNDIPILLSNERWLAKRSKKARNLLGFRNVLCFQSQAGWVLRPQVGPWIYGTIIKLKIAQTKNNLSAKMYGTHNPDFPGENLFELIKH